MTQKTIKFHLDVEIFYRNQSNPEIDTKWKLNGFKTILAYELPSWFQIHDGSEVFSDLKCPVQKCRLTTNRYERHIVDLVLFHEHYVESYHARPKNQIYAVFNMESPVHTVRIPYPGKHLQSIFLTKINPLNTF